MLKYLIEKEFKQIRRNSFLPRLILFMPCLTMLVLPWAASMEVRNINLAVVDNDRSAYSGRLTEKPRRRPISTSSTSRPRTKKR